MPIYLTHKQTTFAVKIMQLKAKSTCSILFECCG